MKWSISHPHIFKRETKLVAKKLEKSSHGESDDVEVVAVDLLDPRRRDALDGVRARLVENVFVIYVKFNFFLCHRCEAHDRFFDRRRDLLDSAADDPDDRYAAEYRMILAFKPREHLPRVIEVARLAEDLSPRRHDGVARYNESFAALAAHKVFVYYFIRDRTALSN